MHIGTDGPDQTPVFMDGPVVGVEEGDVAVVEYLVEVVCGSDEASVFGCVVG